MRFRIILLFLIFSFSSNYGQDQYTQFEQHDFMGQWKIYRSFEDTTKVYLTKFNPTDTQLSDLIHFYKGSYTGKRRIKFSVTKKTMPSCANPTRSYSRQGFFDQGIWKYDIHTQILEIEHPSYNYSYKYKVTRLKSDELLLKQME